MEIISEHPHSIYSLTGQLLSYEFRLGMLEAENSRLRFELNYYKKESSEITKQTITETKNNLIQIRHAISDFTHKL